LTPFKSGVVINEIFKKFIKLETLKISEPENRKLDGLKGLNSEFSI
jgi:hypothetical protein